MPPVWRNLTRRRRRPQSPARCLATPVEQPMTDYATLDAVKARLELDDDEDDDQLTSLVGQVNDWLDGALECAVGPSAASQLILDGSSARADGRMLFVRHGVRTITEVATGAV
jgi:hypothetical protein